MVRTIEKMGSEVLTTYFLIHRSQTVFHCIIMIHHQEATVRRLCQINSPLFSTLIVKESLYLLRQVHPTRLCVLPCCVRTIKLPSDRHLSRLEANQYWGNLWGIALGVSKPWDGPGRWDVAWCACHKRGHLKGPSLWWQPWQPDSSLRFFNTLRPSSRPTIALAIATRRIYCHGWRGSARLVD